VSTDPISLAIDRVGTLGIHVACNDVAASGGEPEWLTSVIFLHGGADAERSLDRITAQMDEAAAELGIAIVGGHSEYNPSLERPLLTLTCMGMADPFVPTGGAEPGDDVILTKGAAIEGTAILASDFEAELLDRGVSPAVLEGALEFYDEIGIIEEARVVRDYATGMHDPTEGGLIDGLLELASASGVTLTIDRSAIPVREETRAVCEAMDVDPLRIFGSGSLVATVPSSETEAVIDGLDARDVEVAHIGHVRATESPSLELDGRTFTEPVRDDLYHLWE